jgi:hypothetical protein
LLAIRRGTRLLLGHLITAALLVGLLLVSPFQTGHADAKRKPVRVIPPELRIVTVSASPNPYSPGTGDLHFAIEIELPKEFDEGSVLEVSSLINSPSMSSMRFLVVRRPVPLQNPVASPITAQRGPTQPRMTVTLAWDGMDQSKQRADSGYYHYEVRAKLLAVGGNGPRTQMNSWPKRGTLIVK